MAEQPGEPPIIPIRPKTTHSRSLSSSYSVYKSVIPAATIFKAPSAKDLFQSNKIMISEARRTPGTLLSAKAAIPKRTKKKPIVETHEAIRCKIQNPNRKERPNQSNVGQFRTLKRILLKLLDAMNIESCARARIEEAILNSCGMRGLRHSNTITLKQEKELLHVVSIITQMAELPIVENDTHKEIEEELE